MLTAGVVIDDWKLEIFKRHLDAAGFSYTVNPGVTDTTLTLRVETVSREALVPIITAAVNEAKKSTKGRSSHRH